MTGLELHDPWLLVLLAVPLALLFLEWRRGGRWKVLHSGLTQLSKAPRGARVYFRRALPAVRALGLAALVIAIARPIGDRTKAPVEGEGIDIALVVDVSGSMRAEDLEPGHTRLEVVKEVLRRFVKGRRGDRMGIIAFARYPITVCPFTLDTDTVAKFVDRLEPAALRNEDGTAIGVALAQAARRLRKSTAKSRVVVLLTDGANNVEDVTPEEAAQLASDLGIRVYTIMAGRDEENPFFPGLSEANSQPLIDIARATGGRFFRAEDAAALADIYGSIDSLEKTRFDESRYDRFTDLFRPFAASGLGLLLASALLDHTWLRRLP